MLPEANKQHKSREWNSDTFCVSREFDLDHRDENGKKKYIIQEKRDKGSIPQVEEIAWHLLLLDHGHMMFTKVTEIFTLLPSSLSQIS